MSEEKPTLPQQEAEIRFDPPENTRKVELPLVYSQFVIGTGHVPIGMHEDMLESLARSLKSLKPKLVSRLLIEGRYLTEPQWRNLVNHKVYQFFWKGRAYRGNKQNQREMIKMVLPKDVEMGDEEVRKMALTKCSVKTLEKEIGYKTAYFPANKIIDMGAGDLVFDLNGPISLRGLLGAVNEFHIGSDELSPGILRLIQSRIASGFAKDAWIVAGLAQPVWENRAYSAVLRAIDMVAPAAERFYRTDKEEE